MTNTPDVKQIPVDGLRNRLDVSYREADRILVSVSSGVLALSVPLASTNEISIPALWTIRLGWLLFLATILLVLRSLRLEQIEKTERIKANGETSDLIRYLYRKLDFLNKTAIWVFALGLITLMIFLLISTWK
jgi:hypothetical protein